MPISTDLYRPLGDTGIRVSPLGLGTVKFGRNTNVKYPTGFQLPDDQAIQTLLGLARDAGINLVDTAPAYGNSESRLGRLLTGRDRWVIVTKVGETYVDGQSAFDFSAAGTRTSVEASLRRLNTDWLDVVLVHCNDPDLDIIRNTDVLATLEGLRDRGLVRAIGVSVKTLAGGLAALETSDLAMVAYGPHDTALAPVLARASELNKGILVKKALASGHANNPATALQQVLSAVAVSSVIVGTINPDHLRENIRSVFPGTN